MSSILRLTYASEATFPSNLQGGVEAEVGRILLQSRTNNSADQIGGVLHYGDGKFFQCLEGEEAVVDRTFRRICQDSRHRRVTPLTQNRVRQRMFKDWSMKYVPIESVIQPILRRHGLSEFDPFRFEENLINSLLSACVLGHDPVADIGASSDEVKSKTPWWKRLLIRG